MKQAGSRAMEADLPNHALAGIATPVRSHRDHTSARNAKVWPYAYSFGFDDNFAPNPPYDPPSHGGSPRLFEGAAKVTVRTQVIACPGGAAPKPIFCPAVVGEFRLPHDDPSYTVPQQLPDCQALVQGM